MTDRRRFLKTGLAVLASAETASITPAADEAWAAIPSPRLTRPPVGRPRTGPSPTRIARIDLFPVLYPVTGYFKFFAGPGGRTGRPAVIIKITANDGSVGWGQSVPLSTWSDETWEGTVAALRIYFAPALNGPQFLAADVLKTPLRIEGGIVHIPTGPGLGDRRRRSESRRSHEA